VASFQDGSNIASIQQAAEVDYNEEPWTHSVEEFGWHYHLFYPDEKCECEYHRTYETNLNFGHSNQNIINYLRAKVPAWEKDVYAGYRTSYGLPRYMTENGWSLDYPARRFVLDLGGFGKIYFHCNEDSGGGGGTVPPGSFLLSSISNSPTEGSGTVYWNVNYNEDHQITHIFNGTDPNLPEKNGRYYKYTWDNNYTDLDVDYYDTDVDENNPQRQWSVGFDSAGRAVEYSAGCSSGCGGGSGEYEKLEYFDETEFDDEDLIKKRFNADGDVIQLNGYETYQYGGYEPDYSVQINNPGFEAPDVFNGYFKVGIPDNWYPTAADPNLVSVYDPNDEQWDDRYDTGEVIPGGEQILTLSNSGTKQNLSHLIIANTVYSLEVDVGAYIDNGNSEATIKLVAVDLYPDDLDPNEPYDPDHDTDPNDLIVIDVEEGSDPEGQGSRLIEGKWVLQEGLWNSTGYPEMTGKQLRIVLEGNLVDMDDVSLTVSVYTGSETSPLLVSRGAIDPNASGVPDMIFVQLEYDSYANTAIKKEWVDGDYARLVKYQYADDTFSTITAKTEFELLNDDPDDPDGTAFTTYYTSQGGDANELSSYTKYPSGKRIDVEEIKDGYVNKSYIYDVDTGNISNVQEYTYGGSYLMKHIDARGGLTEYSYSDTLLDEVKDPEVGGDRQITRYYYDGARRMISQTRKDTDGVAIKTTYQYNATTGFLDRIIVDDDYGGPPIHEGLKQTTEYKYNTFGQVISEIGPDGTVSGKTYGLGGELTNEFVLSGDNDPNNPDNQLTLISQTRYYYDDDSRVEYIKKVKHDGKFTFSDPEDPNDTLQWITTEYEYDFLGRRTAVTEDVDGLALKTTYEYNYQGEIVKTTLPNGKWTKTQRDGRGLVITQSIGYGEGGGETEVAVTEFHYDANKNLVERVAPNNISMVYEYDNFDRLIKTKRGISD
jgi:YD repeat-containing protein